MATFRVGQRVRIIAPEAMNNYGREATVTATDVKGWTRGRGFYVGYAVDVDGSPFPKGECRPGCISSYIYQSHDLEPIQPERNKVVAWETVPGGKPKVPEAV